MATHLISVFSNIQPFFAIFFTYQEKHLDFSFDADHDHRLSFFEFVISCYSDILLFYIYISARLHRLYNLFFSTFYSKQVNEMTYIYLYVFGRNNSNPSFHEKHLPVIALCSGFGWMFSTHRVAVWEFTMENFN